MIVTFAYAIGQVAEGFMLPAAIPAIHGHPGWHNGATVLANIRGVWTPGVVVRKSSAQSKRRQKYLVR